MKESTGELSMVIIVLIAVAAIALLLRQFILPMAEKYITGTWGEVTQGKFSDE